MPAILEIVLGMALLLGGGEALVRGAVAIARRLGLSPLIIGLTLVGYGTSTPELVASLEAALSGVPDIALGNVVGSNIANVLLILGLAVLLSPVRIEPTSFRRDAVALSVSALAAAGLAWTGEVGRLAGLVLVGLVVLYTVQTYRAETAKPDEWGAILAAESELKETARPLDVRLAVLLALGGIVATVVGAGLLIDGAVTVARGLGVSELVIGLTLVAVGTSLPELATALVAAWRGHAELAYGNVVGSNIYNVLGILGVTALVSPLPVPPGLLAFDLPVMLAVTAALILFALTGWRIGRREGATLLAGYLVYLWMLFGGGGLPFG
ncbi:MAG: calcium/sodium antiporter [Geminicoccaceae bacterium]|nr:calcium/sodium antiporter [Geminicoccaceae bacterium]MDW8371828.1 calcium/sodium antiporter [Geminicoccaceae bacterium]